MDGFDLDALIVYLTLANLQAFAASTRISWIIQGRVRTGSVFFDLARPAGYLRQMVNLQLGATLGEVTMLLPVIPVAFLVGLISAPASALVGAAYVASLLLGYAVGVQLGLLMGLVAFWTLEIGGISTLYRLVSQFFAGTMVPLTFFPGPLRALADVLPFQFTGYVPAAIYVGSLSGSQAIRALATQVGWLAVLATVVWWVWRRALTKVVVQGG